MTKDYLDFLQTLQDEDQTIHYSNDECSDEFFGCPEYKEYVDEWA